MLSPFGPSSTQSDTVASDYEISWCGGAALQNIAYDIYESNICCCLDACKQTESQQRERSYMLTQQHQDLFRQYGKIIFCLFTKCENNNYSSNIDFDFIYLR